MRHLSTLAWRQFEAPAVPWQALAPDTEAENAAYVARVELAAADAQLLVSRVSEAGTEDLAALHVAAPSAKRADVPPIACLQLLADGGAMCEHNPALCVVTSSGDIAVVPLGDDAAPAEIVGSLAAGVGAAAWSPEEDVLVVVTAEARPQLLLLSSTFDVLSEAPLATDDFGEDAFVNVGWGSKATQFHGSEGKQAAIKAAQASADGDPRGPLVPDDDREPRISWRADGAYFFVSAVDVGPQSTEHRVLRTYTRAGVLSATSDASVRGISHVLACRPIGNLVATTQRMGAPYAPGQPGRHDVVFFERNGLRHGEFSLRENSAAMPDRRAATAPLPPWSCEHTIRALHWNADGSVLAVVLSRGDQQVLQLWTTGNYHWYLKVEAVYEELHAVAWHPEHALSLFVSHKTVEQRVWWLETPCSHAPPPHDAACVAVVDGPALLLTPFRRQNVPPPMSAMALLEAPSDTTPPPPPVHVAWATEARPDGTTADVLGALYPRGEVLLWRIDYGALDTPPPRPKVAPQRVATLSLPHRVRALQVAVACVRPDEWHVGVLAMDDDEFVLWLTSSESAGAVWAPVPLEGTAARRLVAAPGHAAFGLHDMNGNVTVVDVAGAWTRLDPLDSFCPTWRLLFKDDTLVPLGLTADGRLLVPGRVVAKDVTSFATTHELLIWTTQAHEARFVPLVALGDPAAATDLGRRVERGSRIVTAVPSAMSLVLQMPRGNLETVYPRAMVLDVIRSRLREKQYGDALRLCRAHRVDLNLLHDHAPASFVADMAQVVAQVDVVDHLNLLVTSLRSEDVTETLYRPWDAHRAPPRAPVPDKVNRVCDALLQVLRGADERRYLSTILTAHVRKVPADYEGALRVLRAHMDVDEALADEACKYLIFLVPADQLYKVALGLYDFALALMIAQKSPRDPREYVPFLRELRAKTPLEYQRFCVDDHLGRHARALQWLAAAGPDHANDAMAYMVQHKLYREGIAAWAKAPSRLREVYARFGAYLSAHQRPAEAATAYELAGQWADAVQAWKEADAWQHALRVAALVPGMDGRQLAHTIAEQLEEQQKWLEAAQVLLHVQDIEAGIAMLCRANELVEAQLWCATHQRRDMIETHVAPAALEAQAALLDEIDEMRGQMTKQMQRLAELAAKRHDSGTGAYDDDRSAALDHIDVMSDVSQMTQFTRYTAATSVAASLSTLSLGSQRSSRQKARAKKEAKKKNAGRKGSVYEEAYLHDSLQKLMQTRLGRLQRDAGRLLPVLALLGERHRAAAKTLQEGLLALEADVESARATLEQRHAAEEQERAELLQALVTQVAQLAHAPGAGSVGADALQTLWKWQQSREPRAAPSVAKEAWKLHLLEDTPSRTDAAPPPPPSLPSV